MNLIILSFKLSFYMFRQSMWLVYSFFSFLLVGMLLLLLDTQVFFQFFNDFWNVSSLVDE